MAPNQGIKRGVGMSPPFPSLPPAPKGNVLTLDPTKEAGLGWTTGTPQSGWIPEIHTWTYSSVSGHTSVATVNADVTGIIQVGDRIQLTNNGLVQYFIVTVVAVASGISTVTMYGGNLPIYLNASHTNGGGAVTSLAVLALEFAIPNGSVLIFENGDTVTLTAAAAAGATTITIPSTTPSTNQAGQVAGWTSGQAVSCTNSLLANSAITNPAYSHAKAPFGFNCNPDMWTEFLSDPSLCTQASPSTSPTWYNIGGLSLLVPIGAWDILYQTNLLTQFAATTATGIFVFQSALSTANNTASDPTMVVTADFVIGTSNAIFAGADFGFGVTRSRTVLISAATTYYLLASTATAVQNIYFAGNGSSNNIRAICAYL